MSDPVASFKALKSYCEAENFAGWDPYDGLNSKVFQALPLKKWDLARLAWIQGFKRSPVNFRELLLVPKGHNPMGIGLFLSGYCNLYHLAKGGDLTFGTADEIRDKINKLAHLLENLKSEGYSGACWGYNFDWQARQIFLFPSGTPNVVVTAFCAVPLYEAYEITREKAFLNLALSSARFVTEDLRRTPHNGGFLFSYSPVSGNDTVYNASLLGAKLLTYAYKYSKNTEYRDLAREATMAACRGQNPDGSWIYGLLPVQSWIDSFHTGFNLDAINTYQQVTGDFAFQNELEKGFQYYLENFFEKDGTPKYYHDKTYPVDIHSPGQLLVTLKSLGKTRQHRDLAEKVLGWTIRNMQDKKGYFYYQLKKGWSSKIPYMRWSNAFMFHAMTCYFFEKNLFPIMAKNQQCPGRTHSFKRASDAMHFLKRCEHLCPQVKGSID